MPKLVKLVSSQSATSCFIDGRKRVSIAIGTPDERIHKLRENGSCHWRLIGCDGNDLLSIELLRKSGRLFGVDLIVFTGDILTTGIDYTPSGVEPGIPEFEMADWCDKPTGPNFQDFRKPFSVHAHPSAIQIQILPANLETSWSTMGGRLFLGFTKCRSLASITTTGVSERELSVFLGK